MEDVRPRVKLIGEDGNAFYILAACRQAWRKAGGDADKLKSIEAEMMAGDYGQLLATAAKYYDIY